MRLMLIGLAVIVIASCAEPKTQPEATGTEPDQITGKRNPSFVIAKNQIVLFEETRFAGADEKDTPMTPGIYSVERRGEKDLSLTAQGS